MIICFELSMPNVASWNGRWSGEGSYYALTRSIGRSKADVARANKVLSRRYYHYNFGDGWSAGIHVRLVSSAEARSVRKKSKGFCGYDWMVDSILNNGEIRTRNREVTNGRREETEGKETSATAASLTTQQR